MNVAFREPNEFDPGARRDRRGAAAAVGHRRCLCTHGHVRGRGRRARRADFAPSRAADRGAALPAGDEPAAAGKIRIPEKLPHFLGCVCCLGGPKPRSARPSTASTPAARLDAGAVAGRSRAQPRRLLSGLSAGREPRRGAGARAAVRRRLRLLPARAVEGPRPAAIVPHARICAASARRSRSTISAGAG